MKTPKLSLPSWLMPATTKPASGPKISSLGLVKYLERTSLHLGASLSDEDRGFLRDEIREALSLPDVTTVGDLLHALNGSDCLKARDIAQAHRYEATSGSAPLSPEDLLSRKLVDVAPVPAEHGGWLTIGVRCCSDLAQSAAVYLREPLYVGGLMLTGWAVVIGLPVLRASVAEVKSVDLSSAMQSALAEAAERWAFFETHAHAVSTSFIALAIGAAGVTFLRLLGTTGRSS